MPSFEPRRLAARWIGWTSIRIWGLVPAERLRRALTRAGVWDCGPWTGQAPVEPGSLLLLLGDHVYDEALVAALAHSPNMVLVRGDGMAVAANVPRDRAKAVADALAEGTDLPADLPRRKGAELVSAYQLKLRKRAVPLVMPVTEELQKAVEDRLFAASYKGVTDIVTKYVWPTPACAATRACVNLGLTPNVVTLAGLVLCIAAALLFLGGHLALGLVCAWAMTFLDTVDGKLARVTLSSSRFGDTLDHGIDLIHPPIWWWAWWQGCGSGDLASLAVMLAGYLFLRAEEGLFLWRFGIELHVWRRFDSLFRLVTSRRNPILAILTLGLILGHAEGAFRVAAAWTIVSLTIHAVRLFQATRQGTLSSWMAS